ncbi:MAG TPA: Gfo/Idh/MocA family oxidoreductase [Chthonomonadales bacterium]|nr:Gfo/Idh/MocA family oxidoreductase [Chthonomonadales bacterium]
MTQGISRRELARAAAGAGLVVLADSRSARGYPQNEKLSIALVGSGGRGEWFVSNVPREQNLVALCDVNDDRAAISYGALPGVPKYRDFRRMLEERGREIDGVIVAAPDHVHAAASMMAIRMGKHVFCEKPLTHDIAEARALRRAAARSRVATQLGNQGTSSEGFRRAVEIVRAGALGEVREVYAWNAQGGSGARELPGDDGAPPEHLSWDLWLGPAAERPYHPHWLRWHAWRDFGTGQLGNWATHSMNLPFMALGLDRLWDRPAPGQPAPRVRVRAEVEEVRRVTFPQWEIVTYDFPARGALPPVTVRWVNGSAIPRGRDRLEGFIGRRFDWEGLPGRRTEDFAGCVLVGERGLLHATGHNMSYTLLPANRWVGFEAPPRTLPRTPSHEREWYDACRGGPAPLSSFEYGARLAEFTLIGNIATLHPEGIVYDPVAGRVVSPRNASADLRRARRRGWEL